MSMSAPQFLEHDTIDLSSFARVPLCHQPTPIEFMPRLSEELGGPDLYIKRDDCTGLGMGGNKTRKLEFLLGDALSSDSDILVTQGAVQSNHVRQTAAAACRYGLDCHALLERRVTRDYPRYESTGNIFLDKLFGATLEFRPSGLDMNVEAESVASELRSSGRRPYFIPGGGSNAVGALGYVSCALEIARQESESGVRYDWVVLGTGSAGTQSGLVAGFFALARDLPVMGISVRHPCDRQTSTVHGLTCQTLEQLGHDSVPSDKILVDDSYVGDGYGIPSPQTLEAICLTASCEGILLDPVYSGKGMSGLIGLVRSGFFGSSDKVLFLHTGGSSSLFAYEHLLVSD